MKVIVKGRSVLIDEAGLPIFQSRKWHINDNGYVIWRGVDNGVKKTVRLHREIIGAKDGEIVDHINRNKLDNRLCNLRIVSQKENIHNSDRHDDAKLYYYDKRKKRWTVDSREYGVRSVYVDSEKDAIEFVKKMRKGERTVRNFTPRKITGCRVLPNDKILEIKQKAKWKGDRVSNASELANEYGVSYWTISRIAHNRYGKYARISKRGPAKPKIKDPLAMRAYKQNREAEVPFWNAKGGKNA